MSNALSFNALRTIRYVLVGLVVVSVSSLTKLWFAEVYYIPSASMENTLERGDYILVNKFIYGAELPNSLLEVPWFNLAYWPFADSSDYERTKQEHSRLRTLQLPKRDEVLVFRPFWNRHAPLIKRCVALPGDTFLIRNGLVFINGIARTEPTNLKMEYAVEVTEPKRLTQHLDSLRLSYFREYPKKRFRVFCTASQLDFLKNAIAMDMAGIYAFPTDSTHSAYTDYKALAWTRDNLGPIVLPRKGDVVPLTAAHYEVYKAALRHFENYEILSTDSGYYHQGRRITEVQFRENYYFMLGDNRHQSEDSRAWGLVPEKNLIGRAEWVLFSWGERWRWDRWCTRIE